MLSWTCSSCGGTNPEGTRFCGHCGGAFQPSEALPAATPLPGLDEERRLVTALFADLSGFSRLATALDPERLAEVIDPILAELAAIAAIAAIVERYGGHVEKFAGDALLALFGAPVTHEDDASRAQLAPSTCMKPRRAGRSRRGCHQPASRYTSASTPAKSSRGPSARRYGSTTGCSATRWCSPALAGGGGGGGNVRRARHPGAHPGSLRVRAAGAG